MQESRIGGDAVNHKERVMTALHNYLDSGDEFTFYKAIKDFATMKLYPTQLEFAEVETDKTIEDYVLEIQLATAMALKRGTVRGGVDGFYPWLYRVCDNKSKDYFTHLLKNRGTKVPLLVAKKQQSSSLKEFAKDTQYIVDENPVVFDILYGEKGYDSYNDGNPISDRVQGINRDICLLILDGCTHSQIAKELGMKVGAVDTRVSRLQGNVEAGHIEKGPVEATKSRISASRAFASTIVDVQNSRTRGTIKTIRYGQDRGRPAHTSSPCKVRPNLSDFAIDIWNTARRHLTPGELLYFRQTYFNFDECLQFKQVTVSDGYYRIDSAIRERLGAAFIEVGLYPIAGYLNYAVLDVRKELSSAASKRITRPLAQATKCAKRAA
jgi:hypothetical protein